MGGRASGRAGEDTKKTRTPAALPYDSDYLDGGPDPGEWPPPAPDVNFSPAWTDKNLPIGCLGRSPFQETNSQHELFQLEVPKDKLQFSLHLASQCLRPKDPKD